MNLRSFIIKECEQQNWEGIITRIWPNTKVHIEIAINMCSLPFFLQLRVGRLLYTEPFTDMSCGFDPIEVLLSFKGV